MRVLVDSSVWINWFRGSGGDELDTLIDENLLAINDLILAELIPAMLVRREHRLIKLLETVTRVPLSIDWKDITETRAQCLSQDINGIGIPDLIIAQNARQHEYPVYAEDKHFRWISKVTGLKLY